MESWQCLSPLFVFYFWSSGARFSFPFHYKDFFDTDSNVLVKNGSQTKVSQGLVFPRDVHVPGFEFIYLGPRAEEERMPSFFQSFSVRWLSLFHEKIERLIAGL